jgi:hypothetical protein
MEDQGRMALFARRFAPARCLVLEAGDRVDMAPDGTLPRGAPILTGQGLMAQLAWGGQDGKTRAALEHDSVGDRAFWASMVRATTDRSGRPSGALT